MLMIQIRGSKASWLVLAWGSAELEERSVQDVALGHVKQGAHKTLLAVSR